jgi:protein TonB
MFKIDKKGEIVDIRARAPHKRLEKEAIRVVSILPKMKPGRQRGKAVGVKYSLPIVFNVE